MKIALIGYEANVPYRVGSNQYAFELLKALYQEDHKNHYTVFLPSPPLSDLPEPRDNWQYKIVGPRRFWNILGLPLALFRYHPKLDVVFNPGHYCPLFSPAPLVVSIMDLGYLKFPQHFPKVTYWKLKFWTALSIKRAKNLLTISQRTKNDIIKHYQIEPKKITVAYPGYDQDKFKKKVSEQEIKEVKDRYKIKDDYLLFLSTLKPSKNIEGLLEAFAQLKDQNLSSVIAGKKGWMFETVFAKVKDRYKIKDDYLLFLSTLKPSKNIEGLLEAFAQLKDQNLSLVIAGKKGWMFETVFAKVKDLGLVEKVIFTDFVPDEDVPALLTGAKVFVLPSFWEGFGIPVVEAMVVGTPVVVSNVGSLPEVVGEAGIIVDPKNPKDITRGIKEAFKKREELIDRGFKQVSQYDWGKCARKVLKVLSEDKK